MSTSTSTVQIGDASIITTVVRNDSDITDGLKMFLSNSNNEKKIIGLDTERSIDIHSSCPTESRLAVLQLCDGDNCLIIPLYYLYCNIHMHVSLTNFLNLPDFTFMGTGINETLKMLKKQCCLTCKNAVDVGPLSWDKRRIFNQFVSARNPASTIFEDWNKHSLSENQIKLATTNAYFAFKVGNMIL